MCKNEPNDNQMDIAIALYFAWNKLSAWETDPLP